MRGSLRLVLAVSALLAVGCGSDDGGSKEEACDNRFLCDAPLAFAHRGGAKLRPEETLEAYAHAASLGTHVLEGDLHTTSDGHVVLMHDAEVDRTTDGQGKVHGMTLAELQKLDAGYDFSPDAGATHPWRGKGLTVPTLEQVLTAHADAWWTLEIKQASPSIVDAVLAVVDAAGNAERTVLVSFYDEVLGEIREKRPEILTGMGVGEMLTLSSLNEETEPGYQPPTRIVQPPASAVTAPLMERAIRLKLRIHAWTVNDEPEMTRLLDLGVHGIMTDDPALLVDVISKR